MRRVRKRVRREWKLVIAGVLLMLIGFWLMLPASNTTLTISAHTGSLTLNVLCGERLVWDLPAGRIAPRSTPPGAGTARAGDVTLVLGAGARVQLESTGPGVLRVAVVRAQGIAQSCGAGSAPSFEAMLDGVPLANDPLGFSYAATAPKTGQGSHTLSLPLSGHILVGQAVQQGAGWARGAAGILESGTVTLRVVPLYSDERVTLSVERLDEGSLLDTHACLKDAAEVCPSRNVAAAHGFLRTVPGGGLSVQIYASGPVGMQAFSGEKQHLLIIPNSTAAWRSETLMLVGGALAMLLGLWKHLSSGAGTKRAVTELLELAERALKHKKGSTADAVILFPLLGVITLALVATAALAEPVEIQQGIYTGAGYSFRRGATCLVVTARHVVSEIGVPIAVRDRSGAKAEGSRSYDNESYDLALITLRDSPPAVACTASWPDVAWLRSASFAAGGEFRAIRHYPGGNETIVRLTYAGGTKDRFTLAPIDKLNIRESDSGAIVELGGRLAGVVLSIDTGTDRINVLRFDVIDQLVGDRFRASSRGRLVSYAGVLWQGRQHPAWSTYVHAWITEKAGRTVIPTSQKAAGAPSASCEIKVEVLSWERFAIPNPELDSLQFQLKACGKRGSIYEMLCKGAKTALAKTPRQITSQKITLNATVTPLGAAPVSKLTTSTHMPRSGATLSQSEIELGSLQGAVASTLTDLLARGTCD